MSTATISKGLRKNDDSVTIPRKKYEEFLEFEKIVEKRSEEEADTDEAIKIYKKEWDCSFLLIRSGKRNQGYKEQDFIIFQENQDKKSCEMRKFRPLHLQAVL